MFEPYVAAGKFCTFCYDDAEIREINQSPLRQLKLELSQKLLWETGDHWDDVGTYKHFLPRVLEILAPPHSVEDLYPGHFFETLNYHKFRDWPLVEKSAVVEFLAVSSDQLNCCDDAERDAWLAGIQDLRAAIEDRGKVK